MVANKAFYLRTHNQYVLCALVYLYCRCIVYAAVRISQPTLGIYDFGILFVHFVLTDVYI